MNSGSASAPPIKASKFLLAFYFLKFTSKSITYQLLINLSLQFKASNIANF